MDAEVLNGALKASGFFICARGSLFKKAFKNREKQRTCQRVRRVCPLICQAANLYILFDFD